MMTAKKPGDFLFARLFFLKCFNLCVHRRGSSELVLLLFVLLLILLLVLLSVLLLVLLLTVLLLTVLFVLLCHRFCSLISLLGKKLPRI